jgi:hypothetical protein
VPDLTLDQLTAALAIVAGVALVALVAVVFLVIRLRKLRRDYAILRGEGQEGDIFAIVGRAIRRGQAIEDRVDQIVAEHALQAERARFAVQRFHVVRYDAFEEMGGRLSFSAALLDDHGDGIVLTSINGRTETRTYAKPVKALDSPHNLSQEERQAIEGAVAGHDRGRATSASP